MSKPRALIIGGSMGGLFAANLLHRAGWQVQVLEKSTTPLTSRGTGIATHAGLMKVMELAGARFGEALGTPINTRKAFDASGNILAQLDTQQVMAITCCVSSCARILPLASNALRVLIGVPSASPNLAPASSITFIRPAWVAIPVPRLVNGVVDFSKT